MAQRRWFLMRRITAADVPDRKAAVRELLPLGQDVASKTFLSLVRTKHENVNTH
jgi:hypothetical protein